MWTRRSCASRWSSSATVRRALPLPPPLPLLLPRPPETHTHVPLFFKCWLGIYCVGAHRARPGAAWRKPGGTSCRKPTPVSPALFCRSVCTRLVSCMALSLEPCSLLRERQPAQEKDGSQQSSPPWKEMRGTTDAHSSSRHSAPIARPPPGSKSSW